MSKYHPMSEVRKRKMIDSTVSVIMGIYNCASTLEESLNTLLDQTFQDFHVIMCDDGSKDNTADIAQHYCDIFPKKFMLLRNEKNMGLNYSLNKCLDKSAGKYIARMDGDDLSLPSRFEEEVNYLDHHHAVAIVSTAMIHFDEYGDWGITSPKEFPEPIDLVRDTPFPHAPCMVRKEAYLSVGGYTIDSRLRRVEDYHLWIKMYEKGYQGVNLQKPLYKMRDDRNATKRRNLSARLNEIYVKSIAIRTFKLSRINYIHLLKPLILVLIPKNAYEKIRRYKRRIQSPKSKLRKA